MQIQTCKTIQKHRYRATRVKALGPNALKQAGRLSLVLLLSISLVLQTNITKPLAESLDAPEAPFAWDSNTNVLTIEGDCNASDIEREIENEARSAQEVCFSGVLTITTDQGDFSPFFSAQNLKSITARNDTRVSFEAAAGAAHPTLARFFSSCTSLTSLDGLAAWDVSNITGSQAMGRIFQECTSLASLDALAAWNVSNVTGDRCMQDMFRDCSSLTSLDGLATWDVSNVTGDHCMDSMFSGCSNLSSLDGLADWDVSNVTGDYCMEAMFRSCSKLISLDGLAAWDVSNVTGNFCMDFMFQGCTSLITLDGLAVWDVSNIAGDFCIGSMFQGCTSLQDITGIASWTLVKAKASNFGVYEMFSGCTNITYIKGAPTDAEGFVPTSDMTIPTLVSSYNFCSEAAPKIPVPGHLLLMCWSKSAPLGTWTRQ